MPISTIMLVTVGSAWIRCEMGAEGPMVAATDVPASSTGMPAAISAPKASSIRIRVTGKLKNSAEPRSSATRWLIAASTETSPVAEALANVGKYAQARHAWVTLRHDGHNLDALIGDDGVGRADPAAGTGLRGVATRLAAFDGTMWVHSPAGGPTLVTLEVPCDLSSPRTSHFSGSG